MVRNSGQSHYSFLFTFILTALFAACVLWPSAASAQSYLYGVASYTTGNNPDAVATADFNGDGQLDIAVANSTDNTITVFLSQPNGTIAAGVTYNVGTDPVAIVAADFNGGGHPDLAVVNNGSANVSVLINNGNGTFQAAAPYTVGNQPNSIVAADFNGDGKIDLAVADNADDTVSVLLGNGDGTFQNQTLTLVGQAPDALESGDFNNDGKPDLVLGDSVNNTAAVTVLLSNGDGTFNRIDNSSEGAAYMLALGDFNSDGNLDIVAITGIPGVNGGYDGGYAYTLLGNGDGTLKAPMYDFGAPSFYGLGVADVNHDGKLDLVLVYGPTGTAGGILTFLGNGDGTFQDGGLDSFPYNSNFFINNCLCYIPPGQIMSLADVNGDGQPDVVLTNLATEGFPPSPLLPPLVYVALGNGDGTFSASPHFSLGGSSVPSGAVTADFNGDGKQDIAMIQNAANQQPGAISVLVSNGDGTFQPAKVTNLPSNTYSTLVTGDFNGDGKMDLAATTTIGASSTVSVFLGNGDGTFQSPINTNLPLSATPIAAGDFNDDDKTDLALPSFDDLHGKVSVQIFLSKGDGTFTPGSQLDIAPSPATISGIQVGNFDKDGKLDLAVASSGTIYVFLGNGNGTFAGPTAYTVNFGDGVPITGLALGDFNGDGIPDLAVGAESLENPEGLAVLLGTGTGTFGSPIYNNIPAGFQTAVTGDFNNDGKTDLATGSVLYLGNGDGTFTQSNVPLAGINLGVFTEPQIITADFNSDSVADLATGTSNGAAEVYLSAGTANLAPSPVNFGDVNVGQSSPPQTVTLTNLGIVSIPDFSLSTTGDFSETNTCTAALAVSAQCQIDVTFTPTAPGPLAGTAVIADNAPPNPQVVGLSGTGEASSVSFSPPNLNFNVQEVGTNSAPKTVTLTNSGNQPLIVASVTANANYSETNTCLTGPIQAGGNCSIVVTFSPTSSGPLNGTITVTDNANNQAGSQQTVPLAGNGSTTAVYLSTGSLAFASQGIGTVSPPQPVMLTNAGTSPVTITGITASANFSETNKCTAPLGAGGNCTVEVSFAPSAPGTLNGTLTVTFNAPGSPETVTLSGTGTGAVASLSPASITFPGQLVGTQSAVSKVNLTNTGTTTLVVTRFATTGDFREGNTCPKAGLAPNASCTINVSFVPTAGGARNGTLTVTDNATGSPQTLPLTGTGQDFTLVIASGSSTSASVSPGGTATYTLNTSSLGGLNATVAFTCAGAPVRSTCSVSPATLTPGNTATAVTVTVTTQAGSMIAPWSEKNLPPWDGTNVRLMLLALAGLMLWVGWGLRKKPIVQTACRGYGFRVIALPALLLLLALGVAACGGGNGTGSPTTPGTAAGTYNLTLTGTATVSSQVLTHNVPLALTVH